MEGAAQHGAPCEKLDVKQEEPSPRRSPRSPRSWRPSSVGGMWTPSEGKTNNSPRPHSTETRRHTLHLGEPNSFIRSLSERSISGGMPTTPDRSPDTSSPRNRANHMTICPVKSAKWSWIAEVCLASCERNLRTWSDASATSPSRVAGSDGSETDTSSATGSPDVQTRSRSS